jgi:hypothetical protein
VHQHLRRRLGIGEGAVARRGRNAEEVGERGKADSTYAALEQATGERGGAERGLRQASTVQQDQLPLEEALVETGVVRNEERIAGKAEEAAKNAGDGSRALQLLFAQSCKAGYRLWERHPRIHERLKGVDELERPDPNRPELADLASRSREPGRLEVKDDELGLLEQRVDSFSG